MMKNRPKMASNGPDGPILSIFGPFSAFAFPFGPKNEKIGSNKAFHHYGAQGAPRVNADVGLRNNGLPHVQWTFHTVNGKSIDRAATISESEARNSR